MPFAKRLALLFAAGLAVTVPLPSPAAPAQESLPHLLARMREASGPVWNAHLTSISHVIRSGETVDLKSETQGLRFASYECNGALCAGTYFDGERVYSININGTTLPETNGDDPFLRAERTIASLAFLAPDFTAQGGRIADDGITAISSVPYRTLLVSNGDAVPMLVYVDPKTTSVKYMRDVNGDVTIEYRGYTQVADRYELPMQVLRNGALLERYDRRDEVSTPFEAPHGLAPVFAVRPAVISTDPSLRQRRSLPARLAASRRHVCSIPETPASRSVSSLPNSYTHRPWDRFTYAAWATTQRRSSASAHSRLAV